MTAGVLPPARVLRLAFFPVVGRGYKVILIRPMATSLRRGKRATHCKKDRAIKQFPGDLSRSGHLGIAGQEEFADRPLLVDAADGVGQQPGHVQHLHLGTFLETVEGYGVAHHDLLDGRGVEPGQIVTVTPDFCMSHDNTAAISLTFKKMGVEIDVFNSKIEAARFKKLWKLKLPIYQLLDIVGFHKISKSYDIIHANGAYSGGLPLIFRFPYILHCRGTDVRKNLRQPIIGDLTKIYLKHAKKVLLSTPDLYEYVNKIRKDAMYVPNPIDTDLFRPKPKKGNKIKILLCSGLKAGKGGEKILEAVKLIKKDYPNIEINSSGVGLEPKNQQQAIKNFNVYLIYPKEKIEKFGVRLLPVVDNKKWSEIINEHDIIIGQNVASNIEYTSNGVLGMSELESMACGKPVVGYVRNELYKEPPPILSTGKSSEIAEYVKMLIENKKERKKLGERARRWVVKYHDSKKIAREIFDIYEKVIH